MLIVSTNIHQSVIVDEFNGLERVLKVTVMEARDGRARLAFETLASTPAGVRKSPVSVAEAWERFTSVTGNGQSVAALPRHHRTPRPAQRRNRVTFAAGEPHVR